MARKSLKQRTKRVRLYHNYKGEGFHDAEGKQYTKSEGIELVMTKQATMGQWSGKKKAEETFEGGQYTGGRKKGRKNLKRTEGGNLLNMHGVEFTKEDKRILENKVNKANKYRMNMLEAEGKLPRLSEGKETGQTVRSLQLMGKESDFIISRKSKSLHQFKTREQFERYLDNLDMVNAADYVDKRTELYRENHIEALKNVYGAEADDVKKELESMTLKEYRQLLQSDEDMEINYIYDPSQMEAKLHKMRLILKNWKERHME